MGRFTAAGHSHGRAAHTADLGKKALSIRRSAPSTADARPQPGDHQGGSRGARSHATPSRIDWPATLRQGRPRQRRDLHWQARRQRPSELWLVIVDASASTRRQGALAQAKGLLRELFDRAYRQRARLAVLEAGGQAPRWLSHGQKAGSGLNDWLQHLGAGGGTPVISALEQAQHWLAQRQRHKPAEQHQVIVLTDGRLRDWPALSALPCPSLLIDTERSPIRLGRAQRLAAELGAAYHHIDELAPAAHAPRWKAP